MKILFSGGGTLGPVTPLIAIINEIKKIHPADEIFWVSTKNGVENKLLDELNIKVYQITSAKLRRYFSWQNFVDIFKFIKALGDSYQVIKKINPDIIISAGGFVSVPLVWVGKLLGKRILIHQQDIQFGLANKLMFPFANQITITFLEQLNKFPKKKVILTGNPCRFTKKEIADLNREELLKKYKLNSEKKIVLIIGGGSGSVDLNQSIYNNIQKLTEKAQIIHVTGQGKNKDIFLKDYHQYEFLKKEILDLMFLADLVVSRAGMATLTELSFLGKASIIIPLAGQQEDNVDFFLKKEAVEKSEIKNLTEQIISLLSEEDRRNKLGYNLNKIMPQDSIQKIIKEIYKFN
ncbi:UDP-N-acetylglucosamine--N-acetylmuramyl-(pentapeptide) pyrophosphoryl-undecaprenol N-acetylglucosamine transferase [bacterium]|nr:UDP-N-acetylglucosamine--N-acetylmuramyl-(pentapeptide) pyrophosphoryl-undecaprenol N-acetylglucosamine transferase [bacterium]